MFTCRFCNIRMDSVRCPQCQSISPSRSVMSENDNASFTDYSYNRYDESLIFKIYTAWLKLSAYLFVKNTILARVFNFVLSPLLGGRPNLVFSDNERFIDIGCGRGFFLRFLEKKWSLEGCDIVNYSDKSDNILVGNFEDMSFNKKYTIVRSSHSLEHSLHPKKFLDKIIEITEKNGIIIISSPNAHSFSYRLFKKYWLPFNVDSHFCLLNIPVIKGYLEANGCRVIYKNTYTLFSSAGSLVELLGIKKFTTFFFILFIIFLLPLTFLEFLFNKGDSFMIYAKKI